MILQGDALKVLRTLPDESVQCCVTSPPYYGLRDYGVDGQIGMEDTPEQFISALADVFDEVKRVLKSDGTLWVHTAHTMYLGQFGLNHQANMTFCVREADMRTLEFLLDRDKLMLSKLVEKLLLKYIHNAQKEENRSSLPLEIKELLAKESAARNKDRKVKALGKFLANTPYHLRRSYVRFIRSGPNKARVQFPYSKEIVDDIKDKIDTASWDRATCSWMVRLEDLGTMREILYQRLGVRGDLEDYDDAWLAAEFGLKPGDIRKARMVLQEGQKAAEPTQHDEESKENKKENQ